MSDPIAVWKSPSQPDARRWQLALPITVVAVILCFIGSTALAHYRLSRIDAESAQIADDAAPSIRHLAAAHTEIRNLQLVIARDLDQVLHGEPRKKGDIRKSRDKIAEELRTYLQLPLLPDERALWEDVHSSLSVLYQDASRVVGEIDTDPTRARQDFERLLVPAADKTSAAIERSINLDAQDAHDLAERIRVQRRHATRLALGLDLACALLTFVAAWVLMRTIRSHTQLVEAYAHLNAERAKELEMFAGRVAHDILNPIGNAMLALDLLGRLRDDGSRAKTVQRAAAALSRAHRIVDGLLDFARAGAPPPEEASTSVLEVVSDLAPDLVSEAQAKHIDLRIDALPDQRVQARSGVLTSMVSNLVRNAIKYMGESKVRRIEIRARESQGALRLEVEDTGPGLPPGLGRSVFEPYVRAPGAHQPGIGLGLATVKRMAEAHGGCVGVQSSSGAGALFWFELPTVTRRSP
jgi:signal transduction histidine kinase